MYTSRRRGVCPELLLSVFDHFTNSSVPLCHELSRIRRNYIRVRRLSFSWLLKMSSTQTQSADLDRPKFHRLFKFHDPEVVAVMAILLGLFQLLLSSPIYSISTDMKYIFVFPLCIGSVSVIAGSLGMASERIPRRALLKYCLISGIAGLVGTLIGLVLYVYTASNAPVLPPCKQEYSYVVLGCPDEDFQIFYKWIFGQLLFYDIAALVLHCVLTFSAFKGLRIH